MTGYWILFGAIALLSYLASSTLKTKFTKYSQVTLPHGMTGKEVAEKMLRENGVHDVKVISTNGSLTDHYNPSNKTVNLSETVYGECNVAAAAVAAHECGHAVQHATQYTPLKMRSALVPVVSITSKYVPWVLLGGILMIETFPILLWVGIILFAFTTIFSLVTLPVEIDASRRAIKWLNSASIVSPDTKKYAFDALKWAAYTYVIAAISSLATLLYYVMIAMNGRNRN